MQQGQGDTVPEFEHCDQSEWDYLAVQPKFDIQPDQDRNEEAHCTFVWK